MLAVFCGAAAGRGAGGGGDEMMFGFAAVVVPSASLGREATRLLLLRGMFRGATSGVSWTGATMVVRPLAPCHGGRLDVKAVAAGSVAERESLGGTASGAAGEAGEAGEGTGSDVRGAATCCAGGAGGAGGVGVAAADVAAALVFTPCTVRRRRLANPAIPLAADAAFLSLLLGGSVGLVASTRPRAYSAGLTWLGRPFCELVSSPVCGSQRTSPPL